MRLVLTHLLSLALLVISATRAEEFHPGFSYCYSEPSLGCAVPTHVPRFRAKKGLDAWGQDIIQTHAIVWNVMYRDVMESNKIGFDDPQIGDMAREQLSKVLTYIGNMLERSEPVTYRVEVMTSDDTFGTKYSASCAPAYFNTENSIQSSFAELKYGGADVPFNADMRLKVNFAADNTWYFGDDPSESAATDFFSKMLQEFTHCLGFSAFTQVDGTSRLSKDTRTTFESKFLFGPSQQPIFSAQGGLLVRPGALRDEGGVVFNTFITGSSCPLATVFSPSVFMPSGSLMHLDNSEHPGALMSWRSTSRSYDDIDLAVLQALGYTFANEISICASSRIAADPKRQMCVEPSGNLEFNQTYFAFAAVADEFCVFGCSVPFAFWFESWAELNILGAILDRQYWEFLPDPPATLTLGMENGQTIGNLRGTIKPVNDNSMNPWVLQVSVTMRYFERTGIPKIELTPRAYVPIGPIDVLTWRYFRVDTPVAFSLSGILIGPPGTPLQGMVIQTQSLEIDFDSGRHQVQVGQGASEKNIDFGLATWFRWVVLEQPNNPAFPAMFTNTRFGDRGDINVNLCVIEDSPTAPSVPTTTPPTTLAPTAEPTAQPPTEAPTAPSTIAPTEPTTEPPTTEPPTTEPPTTAPPTTEPPTTEPPTTEPPTTAPPTTEPPTTEPPTTEPPTTEPPTTEPPTTEPPTTEPPTTEPPTTEPPTTEPPTTEPPTTEPPTTEPPTTEPPTTEPPTTIPPTTVPPTMPCPVCVGPIVHGQASGFGMPSVIAPQLQAAAQEDCEKCCTALSFFGEVTVSHCKLLYRGKPCTGREFNSKDKIQAIAKCTCCCLPF